MKESFQFSIAKLNGEVPALDNIILKLGENVSGKKPELADHVIILYDRKKLHAEKLANNRLSFSSLFGMRKPVEYYRVDTYSHASVTFNQVYKIRYTGYGETEIAIKYVFSAMKDGEAILVEELVRRNTPAISLSHKIDKWVDDAVSNNVNTLFTDFEKFTSAFDRFLAEQASRIGLDLLVTTTYKGDLTSLGFIKPSAKEVVVQPRGYNDYLKLGFDAVLVPDKQTNSRMLVTLGHKNRSEFQPLLLSWMQTYVREAVTYNDIASYLHFKVRVGLMDYWNSLLRKEHKGWIVAELVLHSGDVPPASFKFERMEIEGVLKNAKIPLINTVLLNLEDAEKFKNSRIQNLETWIKEKLQQTAHNILSKVSYAELVSNIEQLGSIIKSNLDKQAILIGYRVEYLLTSELVDRARLNFHFQFSDEEQIFQTSLNEKIHLNIHISGRIQSLNHNTWRSTLTPETDFVQEMKKEVLRVVRQLLLRIHADDFYTRFTEVVEPKLVGEIKNLLIDQFNVETSVDISPQIGISAIRQLIIDLQRGQQQIDINCFNEGAKFRVTFSVVAVDPAKWALFFSRNYSTPAEVKESIGERIRIFVENAVRVTVPDIDILRDSRIYELIGKYAREANKVIREKLGLIIDIIDVEQASNKLSDVLFEKNLVSAEAKLRKLMDAIKKVDDEILDALERGDEEWEIQELEDRKGKLQKRLEGEHFNANQLSGQFGDKSFDKLIGASTDTKKISSSDNDGQEL